MGSFVNWNPETFRSKTFWMSMLLAVAGVLQGTGAVEIPEWVFWALGGGTGAAAAERMTKVIKASGSGRVFALLALLSLFGACEGATRLQIADIDILTSGQVVLVDQVGAAPASGEGGWTEIRILPGALSNVRVSRMDLPTGGSDVSMEATASEPKVNLWREIATHVAAFVGGIAVAP